MLANNVLELIGKTPMIKLERLAPNGELLAKLEMFNPGGSVKDRAALKMIEEAEGRGDLKRGSKVLEATSGNTGIGLAIVCALKGYELTLVVPEKARWKIAAARVLGAKIVTVKDMSEALEKARELSEKGFFWVNQHSNQDNWRAHYETTAREILEQTGCKLDVFVAPIGTGGTITGVGRRLKEIGVKVVGVQPARGEKIPGMRNIGEYKPETLDLNVVDEIVEVTAREAREMVVETARREGLLVGLSSGACLHVAVQKAISKRVVALLPDGIWSYLEALEEV